MSSISTSYTEPAPRLSPLVPAASVQDFTEVERHSSLYLCKFIDVKAGGVICSVPCAIIESSILKEKLEALQVGECLNLEGVTFPELQAFLEVVDARLVSGDGNFTIRQWVSALSVADVLQLGHIRSYVAKSIEEGLTRLDPFECIEVAERRRTQEWLLQPFRRICQRAQPLSPSEILRLGPDRASAVAKARENLMKVIHSKGLFDTIYGGSRLYLSAQNTLANHALQVVKAEPSLSQLAPEQHEVLNTGALRDDTKISTTSLSSSNLIVIKLRDRLYRLPLHYFGNKSLIHELASKVGQGPVNLPSDLHTSDWEAYLKIITARPYEQPEPTFAFSEWMGGLRVARKVDHSPASAFIFSQIQKSYPDQDAVDLLEAARLSQAPPSTWLKARYATLSERPTAISPEEMRRMGEEASAEVCRMREQAAYKRGRKEGEVNSTAHQVHQPPETKYDLPEKEKGPGQKQSPPGRPAEMKSKPKGKPSRQSDYTLQDRPPGSDYHLPAIPQGNLPATPQGKYYDPPATPQRNDYNLPAIAQGKHCDVPATPQKERLLSPGCATRDKTQSVPSMVDALEHPKDPPPSKLPW
ncbi:hypothetical protein FRC00_010275 [Tulasnella sp. 408]|nr:hypothetical protein FRC00_010275 [Tulasnella sp. 408]